MLAGGPSLASPSMGFFIVSATAPPRWRLRSRAVALASVVGDTARGGPWMDPHERVAFRRVTQTGWPVHDLTRLTDDGVPIVENEAHTVLHSDADEHYLLAIGRSQSYRQTAALHQAAWAAAAVKFHRRLLVSL